MVAKDVIVVDKTKARFLSLGEANASGKGRGAAGKNLVEKGIFPNPKWQMVQESQKIDSRRGGDHPRVGAHDGQPNISGFGQRSAFTDAENALENEIMRVFARDLCHDLVERVEKHEMEREFILCASPKMLGHLRPHLETGAGKQLKVHEVGKDFANVRDGAIQASLAGLGLIAPH